MVKVGDNIIMLADGYMFKKGDIYTVSQVEEKFFYYSGSLALSISDPRYKIVMNKNEIKKALYRENPKAYFQEARKDGLVYTAIYIPNQRVDVFDPSDTREVWVVTFLVPLNELGETIWGKEIEAKLLIRYIMDK